MFEGHYFEALLRVYFYPSVKDMRILFEQKHDILTFCPKYFDFFNSTNCRAFGKK